MQTDDATGPVAYGYVRMEEPDRIQINRFRLDLATFCGLGGYRLVSVFVDRGVTDEQFARTGFTDLVAAVQVAEADAVVVPTLDHLSPHVSIRDGLKAMVEQLGARLLVTYDETGAVRGPGADR